VEIERKNDNIMYYVVDIYTKFPGKIRLLSCIHGTFAANIALFTRCLINH
jgi:hypothetical protein